MGKKAKKSKPLVVKRKGGRYIDMSKVLWVNACEYAMLAFDEDDRPKVLGLRIGGHNIINHTDKEVVLAFRETTAMMYLAGCIETLEHAGVDITPLLTKDSRSALTLLATLPPL